MISLPFVKDQTYAVLGLGKSGLTAARALKAGGAKVLAWDDGEKARAAADAAGVALTPLSDEASLQDAVALVMSPGIPHSFPKAHPVAAAAKAKGLPLISDVELLLRAQDGARFAGITGTNGKSTTTALLAHILSEADALMDVGGNLGPAALGLKELGVGGTYVLELSSYQIELVHTPAFTVAVLLNITPDHLDRHGGMDGYIAAKRRLFDMMKASGTAVIGVDDEHSKAVAKEVAKMGVRVVPVTIGNPIEGGVWVRDGVLHDSRARDGKTLVANLNKAKALPGPHNWQNAAAAYAAARALWIDPKKAAEAILSFPGLAHRQEKLADIAGVTFVNDSKATNADATSKALACYDATYWIAGGLAKEGGIETLTPWHKSIRHAFLIGKAAEDFARTLEGKVPYTMCGELSVALEAAAKLAWEEKISGATVLLSPACASFDQFANFEARGDAFRDLVKNLSRSSAGAQAVQA
ncbi:MAG TPA: UDP-N-acetylmuramoyl-L-alanine--D-glutamate ligase [Alphaproteobacteria bacterium]|nr:UDP-N-acetylmuramoyl-L-alanine--D-glutamate ligase [Alphaproteobacteria bacterium]